jgi:hypothetical protein
MMTLAFLVLAMSPPAESTGRSVGRGPAEAACVSVDVWPTPRTTRASSHIWAARRLVSLEFQASLRAAETPARVELHVLTPGGHLYQKLSTSPREPPPWRPRRRRTPPAVTARLPVAGTQITQRGLYGRWSVVPYLEGSLEPCGPNASFALGP